MVKIRSATIASVVVLLSTLSTTLADDSWGDTAQYSNKSPVTQEQQSTDAPGWDASKNSDDEKTESSKNDQKSYNFQKSDDDQKSDDQTTNDDTTDAPTNSWTPAPQGPSENNLNQTWESSGKSEDNSDQDDKSDTSPSSEDTQNSRTQAPTMSESSETSYGDNNDDTDTDESSKSTETSESNEDSWKQESVTSSGGSQYSGGTTPSTGTGGGGGNSSPSHGGGKVPDGTWPTSTGSVKFTAPHVIKAGEVFDGKMQTFDRSDITCSEGEGQKDTAVFLVEAGGTLKNAIIGKNQKEGVHCDDHDCTIENVWWDDVCEDALSIKGGSASSVTTVKNCGARSASDKVVQHNSEGTVNIDGFYAENFGKLYRSCGTCGDKARKVTVKNVYAVDPQVSVITVNKNYGDEAILSNIWIKTSDGSNEVKVCQWSQGGDTPSNLGDGPSPPLCQYSESDVHINQDVSQAGGSSPTAPTKSTDGSDISQTQWTPPTESSGNGDGDETTDDAPVPSSAGSQTSQEPVSSSESSGNEDGEDEEQPTSLGGSQTSGGTTPSTGSQTTGGGSGGDSITPPSGGGKVPDGTWPTSTGTVQFAEVKVIKAGEIFDGKMQTFERSDVTCEGQTESGGNTAVFQLEPGATLKNAIIGKNQMEGVHCDKHDCTIDNVWWDDVCEDALSIKGGTASSVSKVIGGGARSADDKVIQHNGYGTVKIDGFYGEDISKLYRSCGTCGDRPKKVSVANVYIVNPENAVVTVNKNWGDEATLSNIWIKSTGDKVKICQWSQGNADGEPSMLGDGPSPPLCQYSESDVHINGDVSQAGGSTPSTGSSSVPVRDGSSVEQASPDESSSNDGNDGALQNQWTRSSSTSSKTSSDDNDNDDGGDNDTTDTSTTSWGGNSKEAPSISSNGNNGDDKKKKDDDKEKTEKSDDDNPGSAQQEETTSNDQSVMQSDVAGEAETNVDPATKQTTKLKKCNVRRRNRD
ncbi:Pectate lyase [Phytophthora palmivora]|uniref:Probable pectate lyase F n=1 Tax=Phytophthora palmivora TaxID=4796 RepID=A0A2P4XL32_9STRA|nr:Pectate lyase [Phytophthora palmivora]